MRFGTVRGANMESSWKPEWHQRSRMVRAVRARVRTAFFGVVRAVGRTDDGRSIITETCRDVVSRPMAALPASALRHAVPYSELGRARGDGLVASRRPVFISARFRSGSTLLWNLFRHVDGCTAYYEPLNERRWFDPAHRGTGTDSTHRHVDEYWREYDGLQELGHHYREDWIRRRLYMDEYSWDPSLVAYVRLLVERAPGQPVLQFNRIDFRLPWFRHTFPGATLVHLYRNPRDQWCSSLLSPSACPSSYGMAEFPAHDYFYLLPWAEDLKYQFPFLNPSLIAHPYQLFYFLWKLSFWFGIAYSHHSLSFEALIANPEFELRRLFRATGVECVDFPRLLTLVEPRPSQWPQYADDEWFRRHEEACEDVLRDFFRSAARSGIRDAAASPLHGMSDALAGGVELPSDVAAARSH